MRFNMRPISRVDLRLSSRRIFSGGELGAVLDREGVSGIIKRGGSGLPFVSCVMIKELESHCYQMHFPRRKHSCLSG